MQWAQLLVEHSQSDGVLAELEHWLAAAERGGERLPLDGPADRRSALTAPARAVHVALSQEETRALLQEVPAAFRTQINDALLAALAITLRRWTGRDRWLVDVEGHGREDLVADLDLSRTVGWFTTIYPVLLDLDGATDAGEAILAVKRHLRSIPRRGIGYGLLRFGRNPSVAQVLAAAPGSEVGFNYLGQLDSVEGGGESLFRLALEGTGPQVSAAARTHLFEIAAAVVGSRLRLEWTYGEGMHESSTVEALAAGFLDALRSVIDHGRQPADAGVTLADFPSARLDPEEFGALASLLDGTNPT
jgi:non-ribosomal peptide synthase protein (TIGR01720 family)